MNRYKNNLKKLFLSVNRKTLPRCLAEPALHVSVIPYLFKLIPLSSVMPATIWILCNSKSMFQIRTSKLKAQLRSHAIFCGDLNIVTIF